MARPASKYPTELELDILKVLWRDGPLHVRQVRDRLTRKLAVTSVMTIMDIMRAKGYLTRHKAGGAFLYQARARQSATTRRMLRDLVDRAFDGSVAAVMVNLLESAELDAAQIKRLRELLNARSGETGHESAHD